MTSKLSIIFICVLFFSFAQATNVSNIGQNKNIAAIISQIDAYYLMGKEHVPYDDVIELSTKVLPHRERYSTDTIAKIYVLLSEAATSKADLAKAFQFASYGLSLGNIALPFKLHFLQKHAEGYYVNGQFSKTLEVCNQAIALAQQPEQMKYLLIALGYRAMAYALLAENELAIKDIKQVTELMQINDFKEHIDILSILSLAYHHLSDFSTAANMQNQLIEMKLSADNFYNLDHNYFSLAKAYKSLGRYDDAYNAFWNAQKIAEEKSSVILQGYIQLGMGQMLLSQEKYFHAYQRLNQAQQLFVGQNQRKPHLSTLIYLADATDKLNRGDESEAFLLQAEKLAEGIDVTKDQIILYQQLHSLYKQKQDYQKALNLFTRYHQLYQHFNSGNTITTAVTISEERIDESSQVLASRLVFDGQLKNSFERKFQSQHKVIILLAIAVLLLCSLVTLLWLKKRTLQLVNQYNENERPKDFLYNPTQTKNLYQLNYKKARKYDYSLAIGYITVDNWKELSFQTSKKIRSEVARAIATLINEATGEFDYVGMLNDSEYLLLCPHQSNDEVQKKLEKLAAALEVNYFADLGGLAVSIGYACDTPTIQDIDPYIFLSRLSERVSPTFTH